MPELPLSPPFDFHGYRVVVAGGSRDIGRSMAFAHADADVSICARGAEAREEIGILLVACGAAARAGCRDLADAVVVSGHVEDAATLDGADALVDDGADRG